MNKKILYHGSQFIVERPKYGIGKIYNDYGRGFYCTENVELAKEWSCPIRNDGYANKYEIDLTDLKVLELNSEKYTILNWLAILLKNRNFDIDSDIGSQAKEYILKNYLPDTDSADIIIGYRADDSYFSFAQDFINNTISVRDLNRAMRLGNLGEQVVLMSESAFSRLKFVGYEIAEAEKYYYLRAERDQLARKEYKQVKKNLKTLREDVFIMDILREEMQSDDPRLQ